MSGLSEFRAAISAGSASGNFCPAIAAHLETIKIEASLVRDYLPSRGGEQLLIATSERLGFKLDCLSICEGAGQAIAVLLMQLRRQADTLLLPSYGFPGYMAFAEVLAYKVSTYDPITMRLVAPANQGHGSFSSRDTVVLISQPHNPSGRLYSELDINTLLGQLDGKPACLVVDTAGAFCEDGGKLIELTSLGSAPRDTAVVTVGSIGKLLGCPGLRLGFLHATDADLVMRAEVLRAHVGRCACPMATALATTLLLDVAYRQALNEARSLVAERIAWLYAAVRKRGAEPIRPDAGCFLVVQDDRPLTALAIHGVAGSVFGITSSRRSRLCVAIDHRSWTEVCERLDA